MFGRINPAPAARYAPKCYGAYGGENTMYRPGTTGTEAANSLRSQAASLQKQALAFFISDPDRYRQLMAQAQALLTQAKEMAAKGDRYIRQNNRPATEATSPEGNNDAAPDEDKPGLSLGAKIAIGAGVLVVAGLAYKAASR